MIGLKKNDRGEAVKGLQMLIETASVELKRFGIDGHYSDETAEGLRKVRTSVRSAAKKGHGDTVTSHAYRQLMKAVAREQGSK